MKKAILAKWAILLLIAGVVAFDLRYLLVPAEYWFILAAGLRGRPNECSIQQAIREARMAASQQAVYPLTPPQSLESKITLHRTESGLDLWHTPQGPIWTVHGDTFLPFLLWEQMRDIYEPEGHEVRKGDIVLDCGANIGAFTRKALSRGASLVVAIEPAPQTIAAFRRNFETEMREGRVILYPKGAWDHDTTMELSTVASNQANNSVVLRLDTETPSTRVALTTIDKMVAELRLPRVDFIKMDIEGAEKPAIKGAENTIRRFRPRMSLSTEHMDSDFQAIPALVHSIEPRYIPTPCDCVEREGRLRALVVAFAAAR